MRRYLWLLVCVLGFVALTGYSADTWAKDKTEAKDTDKEKDKAKPDAKACVAKIHVIKGCTACEAMQDWLRKAGVELQRQDIEQGSYRLYPTVQYSDGTADHGERMYKQLCAIPEKICVVSCSIGTN